MFLSAGELIGGSVHSNRRLVFAERGKSTCDSKVGSQTQNTLVGGEHSHHSAISAPITLLRPRQPFTQGLKGKGLFLRPTTDFSDEELV